MGEGAGDGGKEVFLALAGDGGRERFLLDPINPCTDGLRTLALDAEELRSRTGADGNMDTGGVRCPLASASAKPIPLLGLRPSQAQSRIAGILASIACIAGDEPTPLLDIL